MTEVSIIIPVYNAEKYIKNTLDSIKKQSCVNYEVIIVDDGSTDSSGEICKKYTVDARFIYLKKENGGVSETRNYGLKYATSKWIVFLDSDDELEVNCISNVIKAIHNTNADLICFGYQFKTGSVLGAKCQLSDNLYTFNTVAQAVEELYHRKCLNQVWNKVFNLDIIRTNGIEMDESLWMGEDFMFVLNYLQYVKQIKMETFIGYIYCLDTNGLTSKKRENELASRINQEKKLLEFIKRINGRAKFVYEGVIKIALNYIERTSLTYKDIKHRINECTDNSDVIEASIFLKGQLTKVSAIGFVIRHRLAFMLYLILKMKEKARAVK